MNRPLIKIVFAVLFLRGIMFFSVPVYASEGALSVTFPVEQIFEAPDDAAGEGKTVCSYELKGEGEAPMPPGSQKGVYSFSMGASDQKKLVTLSYTDCGVYRYEISQVTEEREGYVYDRAVYQAAIYIKKTGDGQLVSEMIVQNGSGKKCGNILFENYYMGEDAAVKTSHTKTPPRTGDETEILLWLLLSLGSLSLASFLLGKRRKVL